MFDLSCDNTFQGRGIAQHLSGVGIPDKLQQDIMVPGRCLQDPDIFLPVRFRFLENHYIFASGAYARDFRGLATLFDNEPVIGTRLGYAYNSIIGPLAFNLFWSNYTKKVGAYVSIGYNF